MMGMKEGFFLERNSRITSGLNPLELPGHWKYLTFLCEGPNDSILLRRISLFLDPMVLRIRIRPQEGIDSLILSLERHLEKYLPRGPVIAIYDQDDLKAGYLEKLEVLSRNNPWFICSPVVEKIEAWLMADLEALKGATGLEYNGPLPTDRIEDPKRFFLHFFRVSVRQKKRGYLTKERDFFRAVARRWDHDRARQNNRSLDGFLCLLEERLSFAVRKEEPA